MKTEVLKRREDGKPEVFSLTCQNEDEVHIVERLHVLFHLNHDLKHSIYSRGFHPSLDGMPATIFLELRSNHTQK